MDAKYKGTKTYRVGPARHYRQGRTFQKGELITVTDEEPGPDWELVSEEPQLDVPPAATTPKKK